ncbi:MAG TPA: MFS transporter [Capsulimonadaceae bacterium]
MHTKLGLLTVAIMISLIGFSIIFPLYPSYVSSGLGLGPNVGTNDSRVALYGGLLLSSYALMQFLFAPLWGRLSDKIGRKPVLLISLAGDVVFYALFGTQIHSIVGQFAARMLAGIFSSGTLSVAQAYVADVTPPEERAVGLGMLGAAFGVGFVVGPALGGALGPINLALPMYVASALALLNAIFIYRLLPESRTAEQRAEVGSPATPVSLVQRLASMGKSLAGPLGFLFILTFLVTFAFSLMEGTFPTYIRHFYQTDSQAARASGIAFTFVGVLMVIVQGGLIRRLRTRYSEAQLVLCGVGLMAIGFWLFPAPQTVVALVLGPMVPIAIGSALNSPSLRALVSRLSSANVQGGTMGVSASFDSLARAVGPGFGGWLMAHHGLAAPFYVAGGVMSVAFLWAVAQYRKLSLPIAAAHVTPAPATE